MDAPQADVFVDALSSRPSWWAAATFVMAVVGFKVAMPTACSEVNACEDMHETFPSQFNACAALGLSMVLLNEVISLISTYRGVRETKALVPDIKSRCLPSLLLTIMFSILVAQHSIIASSPTAWYASARIGAAAPGGTGARPVYTMTYIEWLLIVPLLLTVSGHCAMGRPLRELARPIVVTNFYIVLSWLAMLTPDAATRWSLVVATFVLYFYASWDMFNWVVEYERAASPDLSSRRLRPCLSIGLVILFAVYGVVYMSALTGAISPWTERMCHLFLDVGSKLAMGIAFVIIRANEYHRTLTSVLKRVSTSNVALISILRGSFDFMLPCIADESGTCKLPSKSASDMLKLEGELGRQIGGLQIGDLLCEDQEKQTFAAYVRNTLRQAESHENFSTMTLSTTGEWSTEKPGQVPPVAQVLNCRMATGSVSPSGKSQKTVRCAIHLSVVPQSSLTFGQTTWHLMAAVRIEQDQMHAVPEEGILNANETGFEPFNAETVNSDSKDGIVATLNDIACLGMSNMLKSQRGGDSIADDETQSQVTTSTLARLAGKKRAPTASSTSSMGESTGVESATAMELRGLWHGKTGDMRTGYDQTFRFLSDGRHVHVTLLGKTLVCQYTLKCSQTPHHLDLQVLCDDGTLPPPIPYIFMLSGGGALCLCGPADEDMSRPTNFDGPGMCLLTRVPEELADRKHSGCEDTASTAAPSESVPDIRGLHGNDRSSNNSVAGSGFDIGDRAQSVTRMPQAREKDVSPPGSAKSQDSRPAMTAEMLDKYNNSMSMMKLTAVAQMGIAATSLAVVGVSMMRRRS